MYLSSKFDKIVLEILQFTFKSLKDINILKSGQNSFYCAMLYVTQCHKSVNHQKEVFLITLTERESEENIWAWRKYTFLTYLFLTRKVHSFANCYCGQLGTELHRAIGEFLIYVMPFLTIVFCENFPNLAHCFLLIICKSILIF